MQTPYRNPKRSRTEPLLKDRRTRPRPFGNSHRIAISDPELTRRLPRAVENGGACATYQHEPPVCRRGVAKPLQTCCIGVAKCGALVAFVAENHNAFSPSGRWRKLKYDCTLNPSAIARRLLFATRLPPIFSEGVAKRCTALFATFMRSDIPVAIQGRTLPRADHGRVGCVIMQVVTIAILFRNAPTCTPI
jgi:hypothetical protein